MSLTSKQRAYLKGVASKEDTILQLGKDGITDSFIKAVDTAVAAREIVKFKVLENALISVKDAADTVASEIGAQVVTVIGSKAVLYRRSDDNLLGL